MSTIVTVVIPTYRRPERVRRLLAALRSQSLGAEDFRVIIVDDASGDSTVEEVRQLVPELPYRADVVEAPRNRGPGPARNLGWRATDSPFLAFIDDDCVPSPAWLEAGLAALESDPTVGVVQGQTGIPSEVDRLHLPRWSHSQKIPGPTPYFEACNIFYRRQALEAGGGFDEGIARWGEDTAAAWGAKEAGWGTGFAVAAYVDHDVVHRGVRWHMQAAFAQRATVRLAARHPGYRAAALWRPWAVRAVDAKLALAVVGVLGAGRSRRALLLTLPWALHRRPSLRRPQFLRIVAEHAAVDGAGLLGALVGSVENHCLIL